MEQGGLPRVGPFNLKAQERGLITEAVSKIIIESNIVNRSTRDRVWVGYSPNRPDLPCKPYPLSLEKEG
jgi:hypothetical protein